MDLSIITALAFHEKTFSVEQQKELLTFICNNPYQSEYFIEEIHDYVANDLQKENYFNNFIIELLLIAKDSNSPIFNIFLKYIKPNKLEFIQLLEKFKCFDFFNNNFDDFDYNDDDILKIRSLFNFSKNSIQVPIIDYGMKRHIFDYFGIIPKILATSKMDAIDNLDCKFLIKHFNSFSKEEQFNTVLTLFKPEYFNIIFFQDFYNLFTQQINDIIYSLFSNKGYHSEYLIFCKYCFLQENKELNYSKLYSTLSSYKDFSSILPFSIFEKINNNYKDSSISILYLFTIFENITSDYNFCKFAFFEKYPIYKHILPIFEEYETRINIQNF